MRLAPLLAQSPRAYDLWQASHALASKPRQPRPSLDPVIIALVQTGIGTSETLASCAREGIEAEVISDPADLATLELHDNVWLLPIFPGDTLSDGAGDVYRTAAVEADAATRIIYGDDDLVDSSGKKIKPHLKPDWNSELFRHFDYLTGAASVRINTLDHLCRYGPDWPAALIREALDASRGEGGSPTHLRHVLHHRRARPGPKLPLPRVEHSRPESSLPKVTVIVPTRNQRALLSVCIDGLRNTRYRGELEVIVVDNGSDEPSTLEYLATLDKGFATLLRDDGPFNFAALNNRAVEVATGDLLCFLNNDIEVIDPDWLMPLVAQAVRERVGAVGARLLYPNTRIQHAGVVIGIGGAAAHAHRSLTTDEEGYFHRHSLPQFVSAVTAACLVVQRNRFKAVAGFDAERFPVSFNDVDLCLRLADRGWRTVYEPRATLIHHESVSRGFDRKGEGAARQARETAALQERWRTKLAISADSPEVIDPYHHPGLSPLSERFVLRL
ncbi:MAG: glycosyltransferase family 2 protein [Pseudomonadota bacterium]